MAQPVSAHIVSTPSSQGQPYDPVDSDDNTSPWVKLEGNAGPADIHSGRVHGEFPDSGVWKQV
jgi:hypothetical protein